MESLGHLKYTNIALLITRFKYELAVRIIFFEDKISKIDDVYPYSVRESIYTAINEESVRIAEKLYSYDDEAYRLTMKSEIYSEICQEMDRWFEQLPCFFDIYNIALDRLMEKGSVNTIDEYEDIEPKTLNHIWFNECMSYITYMLDKMRMEGR